MKNPNPEVTPCILLAEDHADDVFFIRRAFKKAGLTPEIVVARDGQEAVDYLNSCSTSEFPVPRPLPNLLLLDLNMPRMNGFDVLQWLTARPQFNPLPVIVYSSSNLESDVQRAKSLGADGYCVKPVGSDDLLPFVRHLYKRWLTKPPKPVTLARDSSRMTHMVGQCRD